MFIAAVLNVTLCVCRPYRLNLSVVYGQREITHFPLVSDIFTHNVFASFNLKENQVEMTKFTFFIQNLDNLVLIQF